jgi:hypothetical protein
MTEKTTAEITTYVSITEFATKKGISIPAVHQKCKNGKLPGAYQDGAGHWHIPEEAMQIETKQGRPKSNKEIRTVRPLKATDSEWEIIIKNAAEENMSVNNYIVQSAIKEI